MIIQLFVFEIIAVVVPYFSHIQQHANQHSGWAFYSFHD